VDLYKDSTGGTKYTMTKQTVTINPSTPLSVWVNLNGGFCCKIPNSYADVSTLPGSGNAVPARKPGGMDRLSLYHLISGGGGVGTSLRGSDRLIDIRGKTIPGTGFRAPAPRRSCEGTLKIKKGYFEWYRVK
jgi:hypothetical protein